MNKEINSIDLGRMNNGAHFLYITNMATRSMADVTVFNKCTPLVQALQKAAAYEDECLQLTQKSMLTDEIIEADSLRDRLYAGYRKSVKGFADFPVPEHAQAAKVLLQHMKDYKIDPRMQLDRQTGLMINFIDDLGAKYADQIDLLSLKPFVEQLRAANEKVRSLTNERTDERAGRTLGALREARQASDRVYRDLVKRVNALALIEGDTDYAAFIDYVNAEIEHYKQEVLSKSKKPSAT